MNVFFEGGRRQVHGQDQLAFPEGIVQLRLVSGQTVKVFEFYDPVATRTADLYYRVQRSHGHAHVTWIDGDAFITGAEKRMHAVDSCQCSAAAARLTFVT